MGRREAVMGMLTTGAIVGLVGDDKNYAQKIELPKNCREVYRIVPGGLALISWDSIKPGDSIVMIDYTEGRIVKICRAVAVSVPDQSRSGCPVEFDCKGVVRIDCDPLPVEAPEPE